MGIERNNSGIWVTEKPEWISWEEIHSVLIQSHSENRERGIYMRKPFLPGNEIKQEIGDDGIMLVALDGNTIVGTAALLLKENNTWYNNGKYGYMCFAAVLPEYAGKGVYRELCNKREEIARNRGIDKLSFDTHHNNTHVITINKAQGFKCVDVKVLHDHWNVVMFKWLNGCPYSSLRCKMEYYWRRCRMSIKMRLISFFNNR